MSDGSSLTQSVAEAKTLRREIARIASDYDLEWKGELENLEKGGRKGPASVLDSAQAETKDSTDARGRDGQEVRHADKVASTRRSDIKENKERDEEDEDEDDDDKPLDIDKTIDEADELASQSREQRQKEQAAQRKGEVIDSRNDEKPAAPRKRTKGTGEKKSPTAIERGEARAKKLAEDK